MTEMADLEQVEVWAARDEMDMARLGTLGVKLLRALNESDTFDEVDPVVGLAHRFLDGIGRQLDRTLECSESESALVFSLLLTMLAEVGQYRHETKVGDPVKGAAIREHLKKMATVREHAVKVAKKYLIQPFFNSLSEYIEAEVFPLLESMGDTSGRNSDRARDRFAGFRVIQVSNVVERLYGMRLRTSDSFLTGDAQHPGLLREIYDRKYARFGTSGVRGRWGLDLTEIRAKRVVQAVCDYLKAADVPSYVGAEDLQGKRVVVGYDSRKNARRVASWAAEVFLANGFTVDFSNRDTPTPALVYYLTDYLAEDEVAGLINCTASHNPPEWQGIKFNPRQGYSASTNVTDFIASRANQLQLMNQAAAVMNLDEAERRRLIRGFDPIVNYSNWILGNGQGNQRIPIDPARIRAYYLNGRVVVDEMHGVSRGYLTGLLGEIGVRYSVIHAERDPSLPGLDYANPEEPFINTLKDTVRDLDDAILGLGMDTDADRFGVVDADGTYYRPNQVLPMLVRYLGVDRRLTGRVIATQTGSPLLEKLAGLIPNNEANKPDPGVVPAFVGHPFYRRRVGEREDRVFEHVFMVPVGIKYIEEQRRTDRSYNFYDELPAGWRDTILIGGEESSGLTTRGHVTDKDGVWANLLIMDMVAYYGKSLREIWQDTAALAGWESYGGLLPSNSGRVDVDAVLEAKEELINDFLDRFEGEAAGEATMAGLPIESLLQLETLKVVYAGGIRYDFAEIQLRDERGDDQHYLRVRASGTEPISRIYVESSDPEIAKGLMQVGLRKLEQLSAVEIEKADSDWRLAEILSATKPAELVVRVTREAVARHEEWDVADVIANLDRMMSVAEHRNQRIIGAWIAILSGETTSA